MPYIMVFQVDGGCRNNGYCGAIGAAACVLLRRNRQPHLIWTKRLGYYNPVPTNQRAELTAIILALEIALQRDRQLGIQATLDITIESDSKYAIGCMTTWIRKWERNNWTNAAGRGVANQDLLEEASELEQAILDQQGEVTYKWIPRSENVEADRHCNEELDEM